MSHPDFSQPHDKTQPVLDALAQAEQELETTFERWEELEALKTAHNAEEVSMCATHQTQHWMLCPQCDLTVNCPPYRWAAVRAVRAVTPRWWLTGTNRVNVPRLCAGGAVYAAAGQSVSVYQHACGRAQQPDPLMAIPQVMDREDYRSLATLFLLFVQGIPAFCMIAICCW